MGSTVLRAQDFYKRAYNTSNISGEFYTETIENNVVLSYFTNQNQGSVNVHSIDSCGFLNWSKKIESPENIAHLIGMKTLGDIVYIAAVSGENLASSTFIILKINKNGNLIWSKKYTHTEEYIWYTFDVNSNGDMFLNGNVIIPDQHYNAALKINKNGTVAWAKSIKAAPVWGKSLATKDGGLLVNCASFIYKLTENGQVDWAKTYEKSLQSYALPIESNDGYVIPISRNGLSNSTIFKIDFSGNYTVKPITIDNILIHQISLQNNNIHITATNSLHTGGGATHFQFSPSGTLLQNKTYLTKNLFTVQSKLLQNHTDNPLIVSKTATSQILILKPSLGVHSEYCTDTVLNFPITINLSPQLPKVQNINSNSLLFNVSDINLNISDTIISKTTLCESPKTPITINLGNDTTVCSNQSIQIKAPSNPNYSYQWNTGATTSNIIALDTGKYWVHIQQACDTNVYGDTIEVSYWPNTNVLAEVKPQSANTFESITFKINNTDSITHVKWDYGDGQTDTTFSNTHSYAKSGDYTVILTYTSIYPCTTTKTFNIRIAPSEVDIPNVFTPNGDGVNDNFEITGKDISTYTMEIYNRYGALVYKGSKAWNGLTSFQKEANEGTYFYIIHYTLFNDKTSNPIKGSLSLFR